MEHVQAEQETIREYVEDIDKVAATLESGGESCEQRKEKFKELIDRFERNEDPIHQHMATLMISFLAGLLSARESEETRTISILNDGFACPRVMSGSRSSPRGDSDRPRRADVVLALDAHGASRAITADDAAVSHSPRTTLPT